MHRPHLLLDWHLNCNTNKLTCTLLDGALVYEALAGGFEGYTKVYNNETSRIANDAQWQEEKHWISRHFGKYYGYYQPEDIPGKSDGLITADGLVTSGGLVMSEGLGSEGEYIDHLQRSQYLLEGLDTSPITFFDPTINPEKKPVPAFRTPDKGLTIYKLLPTTRTYYLSDGDQSMPDMDNPKLLEYAHWHGTCPCQMLPHIKSYVLSSYEEMAIAGIHSVAIEKCKLVEWEAPLRPDLQKHFTYPTEHTYILTADNLHTLDN